MVAAQGGDPDAALPRAAYSELVLAAEDGWVRGLDARAVGIAAWRLGAGRARKEDPVDPGAGVCCLVKPGDQVTAGQPVLDLRSNDAGRLGGARQALAAAIEIGPRPAAAGSLILARIGS
jgi:thymidine phosphorylase